MNKVVLVGRLTRDPEIRYAQSENSLAVTRYSLAVDRRFKRDGEPSADFINCVVFGKSAEFASKYFTKGMRVGVSGRIQTGQYTNKDGVKVYTTEVIVEEQEFADSKNEAGNTFRPVATAAPFTPSDSADGFSDIPGLEDEELPFH